jgi:hypothetical protein
MALKSLSGFQPQPLVVALARDTLGSEACWGKRVGRGYRDASVAPTAPTPNQERPEGAIPLGLFVHFLRKS